VPRGGITAKPHAVGTFAYSSQIFRFLICLFSVFFCGFAALPPPVRYLEKERLRLGGVAAKKIACLTESRRLSAREAAKPQNRKAAKPQSHRSRKTTEQ